MKRFGQTIKLKPEGATEYIGQHKKVWPGVLDKIKECNLASYSILYRDNILFAYSEYTGNDFDADMKKIAVRHRPT